MYRDSINSRDLPFLNVNNEIFESIGIEFSINGENYAFLGVNRSPVNWVPFFNETFFNILENNVCTSKTIDTGDFKVKLPFWNFQVTQHTNPFNW